MDHIHQDSDEVAKALDELPVPEPLSNISKIMRLGKQIVEMFQKAVNIIDGDSPMDVVYLADGIHMVVLRNHDPYRVGLFDFTTSSKPIVEFGERIYAPNKVDMHVTDFLEIIEPALVTYERHLKVLEITRGKNWSDKLATMTQGVRTSTSVPLVGESKDLFPLFTNEPDKNGNSAEPIRKFATAVLMSVGTNLGDSSFVGRVGFFYGACIDIVQGKDGRDVNIQFLNREEGVLEITVTPGRVNVSHDDMLAKSVHYENLLKNLSLIKQAMHEAYPTKEAFERLMREMPQFTRQ